MGSNPHGNKNEESISTALHNKKYKELGYLNLKTFIKEIHPSITPDTLILCPYKPGMTKQDIQIVIDESTYYVSVKVGEGNSIHQEKLAPFLEMIKDKYNISESLANDIRMFVWGDGTIDGKAPQENRMNNDTFKKLYPQVIKNIQDFFDVNRIDLLNRFLITGALGGKVDYIYYGTPHDGVWCTAQEAINFQMTAPKGSRTAIGLGDISFQTWNRCINGNKKEKYRDTIQLKWGNIHRDITAIRKSNSSLNMGTHEGDSGEFNFSKELNKNKNATSRYWKILIQNLNISSSLDDIYAVKVSNNVFSNLAQQKVLPKTDLYLIRAKIDSQFLLLNNYQLDEKLINEIKHEIIKGSGVSVKRPDSTKYTIQKLSPSSFKALFGNTYLAAGASLYCNAEEIYKNDSVIAGWSSSYQEIITNIPSIENIGILISDSATTEEILELCKAIKSYCNNRIKELILNDSSISNLIFKGESNFPEPYVAHFIYKNQELLLNTATDISITTGSGRSKGIFTIEIKPK